MNRYLIGICMLVAFGGQAYGQQGFRFLELPASPHALALGGAVVSGMPAAGLWQQNPALLDSSLSGQLMLSHQWLYAGLRHSGMNYAHQFKKAGTWGLGLQYLDYGQMQGYDASGMATGTFTATDYVVQLSHARSWEAYRAGASLKWASSGIAAYRADALLLDAGGAFQHPGRELVAAFAVRNLGLLRRSYTDLQKTTMPLELRLGITFKPQFMPFRFSVTAHQLQQPGPGSGDPLAPVNKEEPALVDNIMRHFAAGTELLLSKNLNLRAGYNHLRRRELRLENAAGMSGFSLGLMLKIRGLQFDYTQAWYHMAGGSSQLGLIVETNRIFKNKI
jgi:hypothetical protein